MIKRMDNWLPYREDTEESTLSRLGVALFRVLAWVFIVAAFVGLLVDLANV